MSLTNTTSRGKELRGGLAAIRAARPTLRAAEERVADYVLAHVDSVIHNSVTELAQASGTSEATVVRFCRAVGCSGFPEMKLMLMRDLARKDERVEPLVGLTAADGVDLIAGSVFQHSMQALFDTMELQQVSELARAVTAVAGAPHIVLFGVGGAATAICDAEHKFQLIGLHAVAYSDPDLQRIAACQLEPGDVSVGISHSGTAPDVVRAMEVAHERGATTIGVTNYPGSALSRVSSVLLCTAGAEIHIAGSVVASRVAEIALIDALFVAVALRREGDSAAMLARVAQADMRPQARD